MDGSPSKMTGLNPQSYQMEYNSEIGIKNKKLKNMYKDYMDYSYPTLHFDLVHLCLPSAQW